MSGRKKPGQEGRALATRPGYDVGYAKPPEHSRFQPGQSGNPQGRPKGAKNKRRGLNAERMKGIILDEAYRGITVKDGDRPVRIPMAQAVMRSIAVNAAKGQVRAQRLFAELLASTESADKILHDEWLETAITYKVEWERELRRREEFGITHLPEPLPHPDHVIIDFDAGTARIVGPRTKEEKVQYDDILRRRDDFAEEVRELTEMRKTCEDPKMVAVIDRDIVHSRRIVEMIDARLGRG